jgi:hypothetical protein
MDDHIGLDAGRDGDGQSRLGNGKREDRAELERDPWGPGFVMTGGGAEREW